MDFSAALVYRVTMKAGGELLLSQETYWPLPDVLHGDLKTLHAQAAGHPAMQLVLSVLTNLPALAAPPAQHEAVGTLSERLTRHLKRVKTLAPQTMSAIPETVLAQGQTWDHRVFVPTSLVAALLHARDKFPQTEAILRASEVAVLSAWRYAKHVYRIDEDVLTRLRTLPPIRRLPETLPGLRAQAIYVPVPGGLDQPHQLGFFAGVDELDGRARLLLLSESRSYGDVVLSPISLPLGAEVQAELKALAEKEQGTNFPASQVARVHRDIALMFNLVVYLGSRETTLTGSDSPQPARPSRVKGGMKFIEAPGPRLWEADLARGERLRTRGVRGSEVGTAPSTASGTVSGTAPGGHGGFRMPPHVRGEHPHRYWVGSGQHRTLEIRWLPDIFVNFGEDGESPLRLHEDLDSTTTSNGR